MEKSIDILINRIRSVLGENEMHMLLYGSVVLDDFRLGWSDIDILCLTEHDFTEEQAQTLVGLRQELAAEMPENAYFRSFEGHICSINAFLNGGNVVYWGTSGQRIKEKCDIDPFSRLVIIENGRMLYGKDIRGLFSRPSYAELREAVRLHYESIREYGSKTGRSLYTAGWILDIARCLYTLRTGKVIGKTQAGEWALKNGCAGDPAVMDRVLHFRKMPLQTKDDADMMDWIGHMGRKVQEYADILEKELNKE